MCNSARPMHHVGFDKLIKQWLFLFIQKFSRDKLVNVVRWWEAHAWLQEDDNVNMGQAPLLILHCVNISYAFTEYMFIHDVIQQSGNLEVEDAGNDFQPVRCSLARQQSLLISHQFRFTVKVIKRSEPWCSSFWCYSDVCTVHEFVSVCDLCTNFYTCLPLHICCLCMLSSPLLCHILCQFGYSLLTLNLPTCALNWAKTIALCTVGFWNNCIHSAMYCTVNLRTIEKSWTAVPFRWEYACLKLRVKFFSHKKGLEYICMKHFDCKHNMKIKKRRP